MNTTKTILAAIATASCTTFASTPVVSNGTMAQSGSSRLVTINYELDSEAVVTLDIQTNNTPCARAPSMSTFPATRGRRCAPCAASGSGMSSRAG